jgi:CheY-like chemotaxis protein
MAAEVLVVEDEPDIRALIVHHLTRDGFRCRVAGDGAEALARLRAGLPDLVVLDLMLPGMDGLELTRRLRAEPAWA